MARFTSKHVRPAKTAPAATNENSSATATGWNSLEELRHMVMSSGCTKAQFDEAIETVGTDPHHVANYLQRYEFSRAETEATNGG